MYLCENRLRRHPHPLNLLNLPLQLRHTPMPINPVRNIALQALAHHPLPVSFFNIIAFTKPGEGVSRTMRGVVSLFLLFILLKESNFYSRLKMYKYSSQNLRYN